MDVSQIIKEHTVLSLGTVVIASFLGGIGTMKFLQDQDSKKYDVVRKGDYILITDLKAKYVDANDLAIAQSKIKNLRAQVEELKVAATIISDKPDDPEGAKKIIRKVQIFKNDTVDYFGIISFSSPKFSGTLKIIRDHLKNEGFPNTEIFVSEEKHFSVISYGYACRGTGIRRAQKRIAAAIKEKGIANPTIVNLTTLASNGFSEYYEGDFFKYYIPRKSKG